MRKRGLSLLVLGAVIAVAGCGSSSDSSSSSRGAASSSESGNARAAVQAARAYVKRLETRPTTFSVPSLKGKPQAGGSVDFIACGLPTCALFGAQVKAAAEAVGWKYKMLNAGLDPQSVAAAYNQAIRDRPSGVIGSGGFNPDLFANQLRQLDQLKIPVALLDVPQAAPGVTGVVLDAKQQRDYGVQLGNWVVADSGGKDAHALIVTSPATPIFTSAHDTFTSTIKGACSSCDVSTFEFPEADIGTKLPTKVTTYLRTHPKINYMFFDFNNEVDGVPAALATAGLAQKVKIMTEDTTPTESAYLKQGQLAVIAGLPWSEMLWGAFNIILTAHEDGDIAAATAVKYPQMLLTADNLPDADHMFPLVAGYQAIFQRSWQGQ
jgi:ABC-type sugar transport system substrate-binding protein